MSTTSREDEQKTNTDKIQNQYSSLLNDGIETANPVNKSHFNQSSLGSKVAVNMYDCLQCYLRIPRCKITLDHSNDKANTCMTFEDEIRERQEPLQEESI
ncbi:unnamed protein product [Adineta steineri]|uniref:Uncharacterized protein n=1 Tax=Adineta steineri TaxID=433720 RepID=A0A815K567_9BILA|nr:unnamed protein product [Adineta steineri]CAF3865394.1 unnamed protein product [Adineta steineri]